MEQGFEFGAAVILFIASIIIYVALTAIYIISEWMIFKKAGEKSWKALIPFYSVFVSHHIVGMSHVWFIIEVITWIAELVFEILESVPKPVDFWFGIFTLTFTLVSGVIQWLFFPGTALLGASGIVFMMIVMSSLSGMKDGRIPLTLILVLILYLGGEIVNGLTLSDNVSQLSHIIGGLCGAFLGLSMRR